jgi:hypothetical protein
MKGFLGTAIVAFGFAGAIGAQAASPEVQTPSPVIYLADNLDEADQLRWCIDTVGRGLSDQLHAHSCKPRGGDVQFAFTKTSPDDETGQIASVAFDGLCANYEGVVPLSLVACDDSSEQRFRYEQTSQTFHPESDPDACLVVGETSRSAGPFMSRDLLVAPCDAIAQKFKSWVIVP